MLIPLALASLAVTGIVNLRVNNNMLTDLAEKGFALKRNKKSEFTHAVKTFSILNFIPIINIGYCLIRNGEMYKNRDAIFAGLIKNGAIERLDKTQNEVLKHTDEKKRARKVLKWRIRENLGYDPVTQRDIDLTKATGAKKTSRVRSALRNLIFIDPKDTAEAKRDDRLRKVLADSDEETKKMLDALLARKSESEKGRSK